MPNVTVAQPDVTLLLDLEGVIRQVTLSSALADEHPQAWIGQPWADTVASGVKSVERMVADARRAGVSGFRTVEQRLPSGRELPIEYNTVRLGGNSGFLAIGRNMPAVAELQTRLVATQQAMERDSWKLRAVETRYRLLFDTADEPVLVVRADDLRVVEANPAAVRAFGGELVGRSLLSGVASSQRALLKGLVDRAREHGKSPGAAIRLGPGKQSWLVRAAEMPVESGPVVLLQLSPAAALAAGRDDPVPIQELLDRLPDGFVVVNREGVIVEVNQAFLDLAQSPAKAAVVGERLGRWLGSPGADLPALLASLQRHGAIRRLATVLNGELGSEREVEISAVGDSAVRPRFVAALVRDAARPAMWAEVPAREALSAAIGSLDLQVGKVPLLELVKSTVEEVEKHSVSAALRQTQGNRTAAAELLGLSRQSLYAKLWRYGLDGASG